MLNGRLPKVNISFPFLRPLQVVYDDNAVQQLKAEVTPEYSPADDAKGPTLVLEAPVVDEGVPFGTWRSEALTQWGKERWFLSVDPVAADRPQKNDIQPKLIPKLYRMERCTTKRRGVSNKRINTGGCAMQVDVTQLGSAGIDRLTSDSAKETSVMSKLLDAVRENAQALLSEDSSTQFSPPVAPADPSVEGGQLINIMA